jgi:hypothetical protein
MVKIQSVYRNQQDNLKCLWGTGYAQEHVCMVMERAVIECDTLAFFVQKAGVSLYATLTGVRYLCKDHITIVFCGIPLTKQEPLMYCE